MKNLVLCLTLITAWAQQSKAQNNTEKYPVSGIIVDHNLEPLVGATVVFLQPSDSIMAGYSITNVAGFFQVKNMTNGDYIMQVAYLGFVSISRMTSVAGSTDLGKIALSEKSQHLDEVEITADHIPILLKKDTIEYNSAAFSTQINDKVEELLRQLPGIEIEEDGTVKAQGEEVEKILVDGKEFFGDDPQIATKNLPAEAVDKVQVFDKLSELAEFTGIDDGERDKTINLTLKEDHKSGAFGDVTGGYGSDQRYEGKASVNQFKDHSQLSILGSANNTNAQNFSLDDYINFSGGLQGLAGGGGRISISMDDMGMAPSNGITTSQSLGINYNRDLSKNTLFESNYFFTGIQNDLNQSSERENKIETGDYRSSQEQNSETNNYNHRLNFRLKHQWTDQDFTLRGNARTNFGNATNGGSNRTFDAYSILANENEYLNLSSGSDLTFETKALYRKRLNDEGRTFVMNIDLTNQNDQVDAEQWSENRIYENQIVGSSLVLNQRQDQTEKVFSYRTRMTFTEAIGQRKYLSLSYLFSGSIDRFSKQFFDLGSDGASNFNEELSDVYNRTFNYHNGGFRFLISRDKSKTTLGLALQSSDLEGVYDNEGTRVNRNFFNVLPSARWSYDFSSSNSLEVDYSTRISAPSAIQLQPFVDNSNPLNIYVGNPDLKAEYDHTLGFNYRLFDMFNFTNLFISARGIYTKDKITNSSSIDDNFVQVLSPVNVDRELALNSYVSFGTPIRAVGAKINADIGAVYSRGIQFINENKNTVDRWMNTYEVSLENRKKKVFDIKAGVRLARNSTQYSQNSSFNQNFSQLTYSSQFRLTLLKKWKLNMNFDYQTYHGESFSNNASFPLLSASISRTFMKFDKAQLKLYVFDLLNENEGINRINEFNYVEDQRFNTIQRYVMLSFTYSLSKFG